MANRENCVYCGKPIEKRSREHIIQNAIGGLYESEDICCPECNNYISKYIDAPFTKTFNAIISRIENFTKTNNKKSKPLYTGKAMYNHEIYNVSLKDGKVVACPKLSKKLKCDISKLEFKILGYDFTIENTSFKNGLAKIAFNFALEKGVPIGVLKKRVEMQILDNKIKNIKFRYPILPFVPLNPIDKYIELETYMELYHNLILFNQGNTLWCYIDLFNTFQYYVLLSDEWDENISVYESYLQLLQKIDRTIPDIYIRKPKHIHAYSMFFNIQPCMDLDIFKKRVAEAIRKVSLKKNMSDVIFSKLGHNYWNTNRLQEMELNESIFYLESLRLYFNEDNWLRDSTFRKITLTEKEMDVVSYPCFLNTLIRKGNIDVHKYASVKFKRLNDFLLSLDNMKNSSKE